MADATTPQTAAPQVPRVLVVYGVPARMKLRDAANRDLGKTFALTTSNKATFEPVLRRGSGIAAELSTLVPKISVGNLRAAREDNIEVDPRTLEVISLSIDSQPIFHFGGASR
jgi:uracil phosphoribosyltransferase